MWYTVKKGVDGLDYAVYILLCADGTLYTGSTNDVEKRLRAHQSGRGAKYTRSRLPVRLVYQEAAPDKGAALRREAAIKKLSREQKLALIENAHEKKTP
jgi:predicted GIY-YIG superfamily endonuclease